MPYDITAEFVEMMSDRLLNSSLPKKSVIKLSESKEYSAVCRRTTVNQ